MVLKLAHWLPDSSPAEMRASHLSSVGYSNYRKKKNVGILQFRQ